METVKANAAFLCNFEVMQMLQKIKDNTQKKQIREGSLATVTYETLRHLQDNECRSQNSQAIESFLEAMKGFKLTKTEKLMMVNTPPRTELEIQLCLAYTNFANITSDIRSNIEDTEQNLNKTTLLMMLPLNPSIVKRIVQESEERLSEEEVGKIIEITNRYFPVDPM